MEWVQILQKVATSLVQTMYICICSGPPILRQALQPEKNGLKLKVVLKWRDIYSEKYNSGVTDSCMVLKWNNCWIVGS